MLCNHGYQCLCFSVTIIILRGNYVLLLLPVVKKELNQICVKNNVKLKIMMIF